MSLELEKIIRPVSEENPAGDFLEYDPLYLKLEEYALGVPAKQMGDSVVEGHDPDWSELRKTCLSLFKRTIDLRIATYLTLSELCLDGLSGFRDGIKMISILLDDYWETLWPNLDEDDDNDPLERMNILSALSPIPGAYQDPMMVIQHLRNASLTFSKQMGNFSLRDIMFANGEIDSDDSSAPDMSVIKAAFMDTPSEKLEMNADAVKECLEMIHGISDSLNEKVGESNSVSFESLLNELKKINKLYEPYLSNPPSAVGSEGDVVAEDDKEEPDGGNMEETSPKQTQAVSISKFEIASRGDAIFVLEKICRYFKEAEPNSPIPFLLKRAIRVANMNYIDLIQEMTPEAIEQVRTVLGISEMYQSESSDDSDSDDSESEESNEE